MPTPSIKHNCRPLWVPGRVIATCNQHYGQHVGLAAGQTAAPVPS